MKTNKKPNSKAKVDLSAVAAAAEKQVEAARKRARLAKAQFKQARRALKQAKKAAKAARKQAKAEAKALKAKAGKATKVPAKAAKRTKARRVATAAVHGKPLSRTALPKPAKPESGPQTTVTSAPISPA
jgi:RIO-like serine/threonine protein kinase